MICAAKLAGELYVVTLPCVMYRSEFLAKLLYKG